MTRLSGITPSGHAQLGNYLGAIQGWARHTTGEDLYFVSDLHAMTSAHNPARLRALTRETLAILLGAGIPEELVFVQSDLLAEHAALTWILECVCTYGEARRMIQFKEKSKGQSGVRLSLLTYPVLMVADILLYGTDQVPVGEDQAQHVELARALARRFNTQYGEVFAVPELQLPPTAARVRDLADPARKMAKSTRDSVGVIYVLDSPDLIRRKIGRAVTDTLGQIAYDPERQPGVANLLEILAGCTGERPEDLTDRVSDYADLKALVADAVIEELRETRKRALELIDDRAELDRIRARGADRARERAQPRLAAARRMAGLC
ncbi:MAG TPA: tryptophan--tRNA ligase [Pseudonocardiaceae bacterium]|nr:tryptophan--tRNA ligase [Pseudonocardiaceae bacterium]